VTPAVLVVGDLVTDVLAIHSTPLAPGSDTPAQVTMRGGGSGANTAAWLAALGVPVVFVGVVGTDGAGTTRVAELTTAGVRTVVRATGHAATGTVVVLSHGDERTFLCDRGANLWLTPDDIDAGLAAGARHLHLSGYPLLDARSRPAGLHALAAATAAGLTTSVDAASAAPLRAVGAAAFLSCVRGADLLLANADEARVLAGDGTPEMVAERLAASFPHAVVKCGAAGAIWASASGLLVSGPAVSRSAVSGPVSSATGVAEPTGAGDAFAAGLLASWLCGGSPADALRAGATAGAAAVGVVGGRPVDPAQLDPP
jgi:sugar/nucleoside kinase (ribokinase family)